MERRLQLSHTCPVYCHHQIYSLWEYEFLSGPDPEKCISTGSFVVMGELLFPMGAFLWVTADHLRCWDSQSQTVTVPAACWHLPVVSSVITSKPHCSQVEDLQLVQDSWMQLQVCYLGLVGTEKTESILQTNSQLSISVNWYILSDSSSHCCFWGNYPIPQNNRCAQSTPFSFPQKQLVSFPTRSFGRALSCYESVITDSCHLGHHSVS